MGEETRFPYELRDAQGGPTGLWDDGHGHLTSAQGKYIGQRTPDGQIYDAQGRLIGRINPYTGQPEWLTRENPLTGEPINHNPVPPY